MEKKQTLVVGASENPERYSYKATERLLNAGHPVLLFAKKPGKIFGLTIETSLPQSQNIHTITMYVGKDHQQDLLVPLLNLKPKRIIFNPGTENGDFIARAQAAGIECVEGCTLVMLASNQF